MLGSSGKSVKNELQNGWQNPAIVFNVLFCIVFCLSTFYASRCPVPSRCQAGSARMLLFSSYLD